MTARLPLLPTALTVLALAILIALGTWQLQRLEWKTGLIETIAARVDQPPIAMPDPKQWPALDLAALEYRPVRVRGRFDHAGEIHVFTSLTAPRGVHGGPGYWVLTPLLLDGGGAVMVNRGFVPERLKEPASRPGSQPDGEVELVGLLRRPGERGYFVPDDDAQANRWFHRDLPAIARTLGRDDLAPFILDARAGSGARADALPQPGETRLTFKNDHLQYALTWYGLAVVLIGIYITYLRSLAHARTPPGCA